MRPQHIWPATPAALACCSVAPRCRALPCAGDRGRRGRCSGSTSGTRNAGRSHHPGYVRATNTPARHRLRRPGPRPHVRRRHLGIRTFPSRRCHRSRPGSRPRRLQGRHPRTAETAPAGRPASRRRHRPGRAFETSRPTASPNRVTGGMIRAAISRTGYAGSSLKACLLDGLGTNLRVNIAAIAADRDNSNHGAGAVIEGV